MHDALVKDFALRTRRNLDILRQLYGQNKKEVFEVTQLMNSLLGLLVFFRPKHLKLIPETPMAELRSQGWPVPKVAEGFAQVENLRQLIRRLRDAVANFDVEFVDREGELAGMKVWNVSDGKKSWEAELTLKEIDGIVVRFVESLVSEARPGDSLRTRRGGSGQ